MLHRLRQSRALSQSDLADTAGLTQQAVSRLETGVGQPTWATVCRLAAALGVDTGEFMPSAVEGEAPGT